MARRPRGPAGRSSPIVGPSAHRLLSAAPVALSVTALALCALARAGVASDPPGDEGAMAHLYQLTILMQVPIICLFVAVAVRQGWRTHLTAIGARLALLASALAAVPVLGL